MPAPARAARTARTARSAQSHGTGRSAAVPRHHRRVSGPMRPLPAGGAAAGAVRTRDRQRTSAFARLSKLPEHRIVDVALRSRGWIVVVALMLGGIVAMQVSLLKLNAGISRAVQTSATLERQNADMQDTIARLSSSERVRNAAADLGMVAPPPGDVGFLRARGQRDDQRAAQRMQPPSADAKALMANGGHDPNAVAAAPTPVATTTITPQATATPVPTATPAPTPPAATSTGVTSTPATTTTTPQG
jgi:hypothetical protein